MAAPLSDLLDLLADPETHEPLTLAKEPELGALRTAIASGKARRRDGQAPSTAFEGALLVPSRKRVYLIEGGIPNLLVDERLELDEPL
jgi:uncharacterized protein YbaR (Trm112 family)